MAMFTENAWREAILSVEKEFKIERLLSEQITAIKAFIEKGNVFVNLSMGYGKLLIYQCISFVYDILHSRARGSSVTVVISPLNALVEDQVKYLGNIGIPAIAIGDETDPVKNGCYLVVYCLPECLLSTQTWREIFSDDDFQEKLVGVAVDEAHCITQWGLSKSSKCPFRKWYGCLGELRYLIPEKCKMMVLTATAPKHTMDQILDSLHMSHDISIIQQSPDKENIAHTKQYLDKNDPIEKQFGSIIEEVKTYGIDTPRTIIYCQTRKQCSVLFRLFDIYLREKLYHGSTSNCKCRIVYMFHAGTPESVKKHIAGQMAHEKGFTRVLIATIAFGMGINCKQVRRIVHFGPSKTIESYTQECGRAGRDGQRSTCILLYNGLLSVHCDNDMKQYLHYEGCLREYLMIHFGYKVDHSQFMCSHDCCSNCQDNFLCYSDTCKQVWSPRLGQDCALPELYESATSKQSKMTRVVTKKDKYLLKERLMTWQKEMLHVHRIESMVTCPNVLLEFNMFHIYQVLDNCHSLFTMNDVLSVVEIWRYKYAVEILRIIREVFGEKDIEIPDDVEISDEEDTIIPEWDVLRHDSTLLEMLDSQDLVDFESTVDTDNSHTISNVCNSNS